MRKVIITVAQFLGFLTIAEQQNNKVGTGLLDQFEKAIKESNDHAKRCDEIAKLKDEKAVKVTKKADEKARKLEVKAERKADKLKRKAASKKAQGNMKSANLRSSAINTKAAGEKSRKFASNLSQLMK